MGYEENPLSKLTEATSEKVFDQKELKKKSFQSKKSFLIILLILLFLVASVEGYYLYSLYFPQSQQKKRVKFENNDNSTEVLESDQDNLVEFETEVENSEVSESGSEGILSTWEEQITLVSGKTLKITKTDTSREGLTYTNPGGEGSGERKIFTYFQDINKMTEGYMFLGRAWDSNVVKSSQEKVALNNIEYQYIFKISGYNVSAAGIGAVYQWNPQVKVHGYEASRIRYYYNPAVEESLALEGYYPKEHEWAGEPYTSGEYTGEGTEVVFCVFDVSNIFPNQSGFLVFDWGDLVNSPFDNCEHINEFKDFKLSVI